MELEPVNILKDVIAYVEVRSNNDNRSAAVCREMQSLGAKVEASFTDDVTHVVYKEGLRRTYLKAQKKGIPLVSVSWLESCKRNQRLMPEADFIPLIEKEPDNVLIKMKQNRRWKKMKSMQPCDFDEEVARSAERNKKQRRRIELANRFKLSEDATPPGGSPAMVLALDTQACPSSPFFGNASRFSSPYQTVVPDTPATPTMKERLEKMRREQRNVIGSDNESPKSSVLETAMLQRKLFEKLAKDIFSVESSDEDDGGETTARVVAKLIEGLGNSSGVSTPVIGDGARPNDPKQDDDDDKEVESIFHSKSPQMTKSSSNCSTRDESGKGNSPRRSTLGSDRKSFGGRKENQRQMGPELVRETRQSTGSSSDESFVLSPMCSNKVPPIVTEVGVSELATELETNTRLTTDIETTASKLSLRSPQSGSNSKGMRSSEDSTPRSSKPVRKTENQPTKPKTIYKRNLFTDPLFSMAVLPVADEDNGSKASPEAPSSNAMASTKNEKPQLSKPKRKRNTEAAEVSFLFAAATGCDKSEKNVTKNPPKRRSKRLSMNNLSRLSPTQDHNSSSLGSSKSSSVKCANISDTSATTMRQTRRSLGTSMSVLYGTDLSVLNSSSYCTSRRSIDEFSTRSFNIKSKKNAAEARNNTLNSTASKKRGSIPITSTKGSNPNKQFSVENIKIETDNSPPSKKRKTSKSVSDVEGNSSRKSSGSGSDSSTDRLASPSTLRHANSLVMETTAGKNIGRRQLSLVMTSLHRHEQDVVRAVIKKLGVFKPVDNVNALTTHVVCGEPRRTLNLLRGIAGGCWVLKKEWVLESLEKGEWLMEDNYEMAEEFPPAKECRLKRHEVGKSYKADLFSHLGPIFVSSDCVPPRQDLVHLIMLCSGKVSSSKPRASLFIGMEHVPDKTIVKPTWILDSIMKMSLQDPGDYVIPAISHRRVNSPEF